MAKLTEAQTAMMEQARHGDTRADLLQGHPRTYESLRDRGLMDIERKGSGLRYAFLTDAGRAALSASKEDTK